MDRNCASCSSRRLTLGSLTLGFPMSAIYSMGCDLGAFCGTPTGVSRTFQVLGAHVSDLRRLSSRACRDKDIQ